MRNKPDNKGGNDLNCRRTKIPVTPRSKTAFLCVLVLPMRNFPRRIPTGKTIRILTMLEPIILPKAKPVSFFIKAISETESSGNDVPKATRVMPIISGEIRKAREIFFANLTNIRVESKRTRTLKQNFSNKSNIHIYCTIEGSPPAKFFAPRPACAR